MNHCILMAEIVQDPQLRYTPDQMAVAEMLVQFSALKAEDPPSTLKVIGWGNLAQTIQEGYHSGDRIILEGRLGMNTIDRPEGFKEKRAELTVQRIHRLEAGTELTGYASASAVATASSTAESLPSPSQSSLPMPSQSTSIPTANPDYDDIPF